MSWLARLRNPAHTGENRCVPCTAVNLAFAVIAAALLALVTVELAAAAFLVFALAIYLRGYLVPGTPSLTERYLPERVLAAFDHADDEPGWETVEKLERHRRDAIDPDRFLADAGAVDGEGEDRRPTEAFAARVDEHTAGLRDGFAERAVVAELLAADPGDVTVEDRAYPAFEVDHRVRTWPGEAALVADVAAHRALAETTDRWGDVPLEQRLDVLASLRTLHDACPACGGDVGESTHTVESCCRSLAVVALVCDDCGDHLLERDPSAGTGKLTR